jgi:hypothetical protein
MDKRLRIAARREVAKQRLLTMRENCPVLAFRAWFWFVGWDRLACRWRELGYRHAHRVDS